MVKIVSTSGAGGPAPVPRDDNKTGGARFFLDDGASPLTQKARLSSVAGIGLESMLALQAVDEGEERNRRARKRGTAMISGLTNLQRMLLGDEDPAQALRLLNELAIEHGDADDPGLGAIVRAIALRARVEVARRKRHGA